MNLSKPPSTDKPQAQETGLIEWFLDEFVPRFGTQSLYILIGLIVVVGGIVYITNMRQAQQSRENKELGRAFMYFNEEKPDSAEAYLAGFLKESHSRLVQDKANLMLGSIEYAKGKYDDAIKAYAQVDLSSKSHALISSGALHGLASSYMQKKQYDKAAEELENFVDRFMRKTGSPSEKVEGKEVQDLSPAVPNALWKLALCYHELHNADKAKAAAGKLVKIYPESREAFDATRFLAQNQ